MKQLNFEPGIDFAQGMDESDPLKNFRNEFYIADPGTIYLDGNSLGRLPEKTRNKLNAVTDHQWGNRLIRSWNEGWYTKSTEISRKIAQIIGAEDEEVATCDSTSMNLYKLAWAAIMLQKGRSKIVSDTLNFPTDLYVLQGIIDQTGGEYELILVSSHDGLTVDLKSLADAIDENTALAVLSHVTFKSAFMYDMEAVTKLAHEKGAMILWDLSHAAGAVPVALNHAKADLAIGCTYKYLNGGPGSPAYLYIRKDLHEKLNPPVWGWFGESDPFAFDLNYTAAKGIRKFMVGTPPVLSLEAISTGLDITLEAGIRNIREKSIRQTEYLVYLVKENLMKFGFSVGSPLDDSKRGSHISLQHPEAYRICKALINPQPDTAIIIPDFREPDNIRIGITPLYTTFTEIYIAVTRLKEIVVQKEFEHFSKAKEAVT